MIAQPGVTAPIASATSLAQLESLIRAATLALTADDVAALDPGQRAISGRRRARLRPIVARPD